LIFLVGAGAVGPNVVKGAAIEQAQVIIAIDRDPQRLAMARAFDTMQRFWEAQ
jgi:Zn-dependent alcohol dehydrogenase